MDFTKEQKDAIIKDYCDKKDIEDIIKIFNAEEHDIRKILKESYIDRKYNNFSEELSDRIVYLYSKIHLTQKQICYDLLISTVGIKNTLKRYNIPLRSFSDVNRKYKRDQHYFDKIDTPNKAYILGLLYSDGCNHLEHNSITISLQEQDVEILKAIKKELAYEGPLRFTELHKKNSNYKNQYALVINDEYMSQKLVELGVVNAKSLKITFPDFLNSELLPHFIRGYFDGDGNIYYYLKENKCSTQTVGTADFCHALHEILLKMNCKNNIKHPKQCHENTFVIQTSGNKSSFTFLSWIYQNADMKIERKYQQYLLFLEKYHTK